MKINTKYFGEMDVAETDVIHFPEPLQGFELSPEYIIIRFDDDDDSLLCLQSMVDPNLAFVLVNPFYLIEDYAPSITMEDLDTLEAEQNTPLAFYAVAVIHENWMDSTINLRCPIAVNPEKQLGKQLIMDQNAYSMRHPISAGSQKEV